MKIVSFYCDDKSNTYSKYAKRFINNVNSLGFSYHVEEKSPWIKRNGERFQNQHHANCKWKPYVIENALKEANTCLWVDIDCYINKINYIPENFDIGYFNNVPDNYKNKISVGWIWFKNTTNTHRFLKSWQSALINSPQDHNAFSKTYQKFKNIINIINVTDSLEILHNKELI